MGIHIVNEVLNKVGGECFRPLATAKSAGGLCANADQSLANMDQIRQVSDALSNCSPMSNSPNPQGGGEASPVIKFLAGVVLAAGVASVNPLAGACIGAGSSFHAGLQSMKPSSQYYSLEQSLAEFSMRDDGNSGEQPYRDICGDSYTMAGQRLSSNPIAAAPKMAPIQQAANFIASQNSPEDIQKDIAAIWRQQLSDFGATRYAIDKAGYNIELAGIPNLDNNKFSELNKAAPRPIALNVGMGSGGPSFG